MTLPDERYRAVIRTQDFLISLMDPKKTPRVPKEIREEARRCLRHFPRTFDMDLAATSAPSVFETPNKVDALTKLVYEYEKKEL